MLMRIEDLLPRQDQDCIPCPDHPPPCNCTATQQCIFINRDCHNTCSTFKCIDGAADDNSSSTSSGPSKGALAGGIVGALVFLGVAVAAWFWYRRSGRFSHLRRVPVRPEDKPAPAAMVLNRPDPTEKPPTVRSEVGTSSVRVYPTSSSNTTIDLDPESNVASNPSRRSSRAPSDPFGDNNSIQTAGTEGTNVIPIALVSPDGGASSIGPSRPVRSPELNLNLEHVNVSNDSVRQQQAGYAVSQISGISGVSSRNSYMSNASYSSDFLNEAPMIMTATKDTVRQVTRAAKPEFIKAPPPSDSLKPPAAYTKRPSVGSPLAGASFGPADITPPPSDDGHENADPFNDKHASTMASPSASITTFGQPSTPLPNRESADPEWETPTLPYTKSENDHSRPSSLSTQAGTVIEIENARRVNVGLSQLTDDVSPQTATFPRSPYRTTMGKLISPMSGGTAGEGGLEEQQQIALAHAQAQARALDDSRRTSGSSFLSAVSTSTRADSILSSFPFVPPSPISNRPMRSPPVSPLAQQSFAQAQQQKQKQNPSPTTPTQATFSSQHDAASDAGLVPPDRRMLGMSTASQLSTASTGLGSFPFQIETPSDTPVPTTGRQRASLDTLALTSDLASYPLGFDRESSLPYDAKP